MQLFLAPAHEPGRVQYDDSTLWMAQLPVFREDPSISQISWRRLSRYSAARSYTLPKNSAGDWLRYDAYCRAH